MIDKVGESDMKRTTVFVEDELLLEAQHLAKQRETTFTDVIQDALRAYVQANRSPRHISFIGIGRSGRSPEEFRPGWDEEELRAGIGVNGWSHDQNEQQGRQQPVNSQAARDEPAHKRPLSATTHHVTAARNARPE